MALCILATLSSMQCSRDQVARIRGWMACRTAMRVARNPSNSSIKAPDTALKSLPPPFAGSWAAKASAGRKNPCALRFERSAAKPTSALIQVRQGIRQTFAAPAGSRQYLDDIGAGLRGRHPVTAFLPGNCRSDTHNSRCAGTSCGHGSPVTMRATFLGAYPLRCDLRCAPRHARCPDVPTRGRRRCGYVNSVGILSMRSLGAQAAERLFSRLHPGQATGGSGRPGCQPAACRRSSRAATSSRAT